MALTASTMLPLGTPAPQFALPDTISGKLITLNDLKSDHATVMMFLCNHCPFVQHIQSALATVAKTYQSKGVAFVAISANDIINYPDDSPEHMKQLAQTLDFTFPYLYDETQAVAKAYQAACTPDFYIFDHMLTCVYRGRFDNSTPGKPTPITGKDLTDALDNLLAGQPINPDQQPSVGCNIKWKP